jgi:hypothetical protein
MGVALLGVVGWFVGACGTSAAPSAAVMSNCQAGQAAPARVPAPDPVETSTQDPNYDATVRAVEQLLASVPEPVGATQVLTAPTAELSGPPFGVDPSSLVYRSTLWTVPLSMTDAEMFYLGHRVAGSTGAKFWVEPVDQMIFRVPAGDAFTAATIYVDVMTYQSGVAVRVDAAAVWIPTKPASEHIGSVDSVDVTVDRNGAAPTVGCTLTGAPAQRLAAAVDALRPEPHYGLVLPCPISLDGGTDTLVFHAAGHSITAAVTVGGCGGVDVDVDGVAQPPLDGDVDSQVLAELGLPPTYGASQLHTGSAAPRS